MRGHWSVCLQAVSRDRAISPDPADLIALQALARGRRLTQGRVASAFLPGQHRVLQRGRGLDFAELRAYQPGDDVRSIDWRRTARHGLPCTKLYHMERERTLRLLVDLGPGMRFGTRQVFKSVAASRAATLLAWQAEQAGDRVAGVIRHEGWIALPSRGRRAGVLALIQALSQPVPGPADVLAAGLQRLSRDAGTGDQVVLFSDFRDLDESATRQIVALGRRVACRLVHVHDPFEAEPPPPGVLALTDGTRQVTLDYSDAAVRARHVAAFAAHCACLDAVAREARAQLLHLSTAHPPAVVFG